jgi:hypothetical protein
MVQSTKWGSFVIAHRLKGHRAHTHLADARVLQTLEHGHGAHKILDLGGEFGLVGKECAGTVNGDFATVTVLPVQN